MDGVLQSELNDHDKLRYDECILIPRTASRGKPGSSPSVGLGSFERVTLGGAP